MVLPLLALTFLFGPAGLLGFAVLRTLWSRRRAAASDAIGSAAGPRIDPPFAQWPRELLIRDRRLAIFGALLLVLVIPIAIGAAVDDRTLRGADVWIKPMKFAVSIALLAFTTAWFAGHLPAARRESRSMRRIAWLLIATGGFELAYITLQAALGQGSHYNTGDPLHAAMYALMGLGALLLTATQPMLAWELFRHPDRSRPVAYRLAILIGLVLTFVFGAGVGAALANLQPPSGVASLPLLGWSLRGGDLRPAHFVGIHAEQILAIVGFAVARRPHAKAIVGIATLAYAAAFAVLVASGLRA